MLWNRIIGAGGFGDTTSYAFTQGGLEDHTAGATDIENVNIGPAASDRHVVVFISSVDTGDYAGTMTIGGITATQHLLANDQDRGIVVCYGADVPTGTTATIAYTLADGPLKEMQYAVYSLYGYSTTLYDTGKGGSNGGNPTTTVDTGAENDLILAYGADRSALSTSGLPTLSNVTVDSAEHNNPDRGEYACGSHLATGPETGRSIVFTPADPVRGNIAVVVFQPS